MIREAQRLVTAPKGVQSRLSVHYRVELPNSLQKWKCSVGTLSFHKGHHLPHMRDVRSRIADYDREVGEYVIARKGINENANIRGATPHESAEN